MAKVHRTYAEALASIEDDMRKIVSGEGDAYEAARRIWADAMAAVGAPGDRDQAMHPTWLIWGALTDLARTEATGDRSSPGGNAEGCQGLALAGRRHVSETRLLRSLDIRRTWVREAERLGCLTLPGENQLAHRSNGRLASLAAVDRHRVGVIR